MAKLFVPNDFARVLGDLVTGDPPQIRLRLIDVQGNTAIAEPYSRVDVNLDTGLVVLVSKTTLTKFVNNFLQDLIGFKGGH